MNLTKTLIICLLSFFYSTTVLLAQEKQPIIEVLNRLEAKFDVKFSYAVKDLKDVLVEIPDDHISLNTILETLNNNTLLQFEFLTERYITISTKNKLISICGSVLSAQDKVPLFGASVIVKNTLKGVITGSDGEFQMENINVDAVIDISYLGYESLSINAVDLVANEG